MAPILLWLILVLCLLISVVKYLMGIETGDARFRITVLSDYLARNY
jgi:hypothetical protein